MKLPKTFIPEKNLDEMIESMMLEMNNEDSSDKKIVSILLKSCNIYAKKRLDKFIYLDEAYELGEKIASKLPYFTKHDLEGLSKKLTVKNCQDMHIGFYLSALINKIITPNDLITLNLDIELYGIGAYQEQGTVSINGDLGYFAGHFLQGGTLIVEGNTGDRTGNGMRLGKIVITGGAGEDTGDFMSGGEIITYGRIKSIAETCKGRIYSEGKKLR